MIGSQLYQSRDLFTFESLPYLYIFLENLFFFKICTLLFSVYMLYVPTVEKKIKEYKKKKHNEGEKIPPCYHPETFRDH